MAAEFYTGNGPVIFPSSLGLSYYNGSQSTSVSVPTTGLKIVVTGGEVDVTTPAELSSIVVVGGLAVLSNKNAAANGGSLIVGAGVAAFGGVVAANTAGSAAVPPVRKFHRDAATACRRWAPRVLAKAFDVAIALGRTAKPASSVAWPAASGTVASVSPLTAAAHDQVLQAGVRCLPAADVGWLWSASADDSVDQSKNQSLYRDKT